jgi:hypothetical protein
MKLVLIATDSGEITLRTIHRWTGFFFLIRSIIIELILKHLLFIVRFFLAFPFPVDAQTTKGGMEFLVTATVNR